MNSDFYRIVINPSVNNAWFLGEPKDQKGNILDARMFTEGHSVNIHDLLTLPIIEQGESTHFSLAAFDVPVVHESIGEAIKNTANGSIQRIPIMIQGNIGAYEILNVTTVLDCVDEVNSTFIKWTSTDHRPDLVGVYRVIRKLKIRKNESMQPVFRIKGYNIALIVSNEIKLALENIGVDGIRFQLV